MEELQKLYDVLVREGKYTKSFEEFQSKWNQDQTYKTQVYDVMSRDGFYTKDKNSFLQKYSGNVIQSPTEPIPTVKKKDIGASSVQTPPPNTTELPSEAISSATPLPKAKKPVSANEWEQEGYKSASIQNWLGIDEDSAINKPAHWVNAIMQQGTVEALKVADNVVNASKNMLREQGFFDDEIPDTKTPISDAVKNQIKKENEGKTSGLKMYKPEAQQGLFSKIINSALSQEQKNTITESLNNGSSHIKNWISGVEKYQEEYAPDEYLVNKVAKGVSGFAPDLFAAAALNNPALAEARLAAATKKVPAIVSKLAPKATKLFVEGVIAPITKVFAAKGALESVANAEEDDNLFTEGLIGGVKGLAEGVYMHFLGAAAGAVAPKIAKVISKANINSAISTTIATPLANAGVFATAKALRTGITEQRLITPEEIAMEAGTGIAFSLAHLGAQAKNHNELNHYYDNVLKDDNMASIGRVLNETKDNLDIAHSPNLKPTEVKELTEARNEIKKAILTEPDLKNKQTLGNEALKIQNKLDAHYAINDIVKNKEGIITAINENEGFSVEDKTKYTQKVAAIADYFDNSEFGLKKKELNTKIDEAQKNLDDASLGFTNLKKPSDRVQAKIEIEKKRVELERLNTELTDLITNKTEQDAIQKQGTDESVLLPKQPELGLQEVGEGNAKPEEPTKETIINEKTGKIDLSEHTHTLKAKEDLLSEIESTKENISKQKGLERLPIFNYEKNRLKELEKAKTLLEEDPLQYYKDLLKEEIDYQSKNPKETNQVWIDNLQKKVNDLEEASKINFRDFSDIKVYQSPDDNFRIMGVTKDGFKGFEPIDIFYKTQEEAQAKLNEYVKQFKKDDLAVKPAEEVLPPVPEGYDIVTEKPTIEEKNGTFYVTDEKGITNGYETREAAELAIKPIEPIVTEPVATELIVTEPKLTTQGLSEAELPGYDRMMTEAEAIVAKKKRGRKQAEMHDAVMGYVTGSKVYENATDVQREALVRDVRKRFGIKEKSAPSVGKLFGKLKDIAKITMTEKAALVKQIKDYAKGARETDLTIRKAVDQLTKEVKELAAGGKITANQASNVLRKLGKTNVLSETSVSRFTDYMSKVFANAEYADQLKIAKKAKTDINSLSKNANKNANLRDLGTKFSEIDPSMVEDIYAYNKIAAKIKEAIKGSTIRGEKVNFSETIKIDEAIEFTNKAIEEQNKKIREEKIAELQDLLGVDASIFSAEEIDALLESKKPLSDENEKIVRTTIKKAFDVYSTMIKDAIKTGKDIFTGKDVSYKPNDKTVIEEFMAMDVTQLKPKDALAAVDALHNFLVNQSTAKMGTVVAEYTGEKNIKDLYDAGQRAVPLKKLWSKPFARILVESVNTLPITFERIFKGAKAGLKVMSKMGINKVINGRATAITKANNMSKDYIKLFYDKKANGEKFNTAYNDAERGMSAFMQRNVIGTEIEMQKEFSRRKRLVEGSIDVLSKGDDKQQEKAKIYQKVYDKVVKDSDNIQSIKDKTDKVNLEAIEQWHQNWKENYEDLADISLNIYNQILDKDLNYSPDKFARLDRSERIEVEDNESAFNKNNGTLYTKESGSLMKAVKPEGLPKNEKGKTESYVDFSFDNNNVNSMHDALVDVHTAASIRQVKAFVESEFFDKVITQKEDRELLKRRINLYVSNIRNKNEYSNDEIANGMKILNRASTIGVGMALGGVTQPFKQVIPVAINTVVNAGRLDLGTPFDPKFNNFLNNSGYATANRGLESQAEVESLNKKVEQAAKGGGEQTLKAIEKANRWWLDTFLVKPDVYIARASWKTYYERELKKQGIDTKNLDYENHKLNEEAGDYAEMMVARQQNVSDHELGGALFTKKTVERKALVKIFMSFASFRMNQSSRLASDLSTISNWKTSTGEDKVIAAKSLAGYGAEMITFKLMSAGIAIGIGTLAKNIMGIEESDEDMDKRVTSVMKGQLTGAFTDTFSPLPFLDKPIQALAEPSLTALEKATGLPLSIYGVKKEDYVKSLGSFGIAFQRSGELYDVLNLAATGRYTDEFGKEKEISEENQGHIQTMIPFAVGSTIGVMPSEVASIVRNVVKFSKKKSTTNEELEIKSQNKEDKEQVIEDKVNALEKVINNTKDSKIAEAAQEKIDELSTNDKEALKQLTEERKQIKEAKAQLLQDDKTGEVYDTETDLKRYNKKLWIKNFGPKSDWEKTYKYKDEANSQMNEELKKEKDKAHNYKAPVKKTKHRSSSSSSYSSTKTNSDGSVRRTIRTTSRSSD